MNTEPICKYCGMALFYIETDDFDIESDDIIYLRVNGKCIKCRRNYFWYEKYRYENFCDLTEITP